MIKITPAKEHWMRCNACGNRNATDPKEISFSIDGSAARFEILCGACRKELIEKLKEVTDED